MTSLRGASKARRSWSGLGLPPRRSYNNDGDLRDGGPDNERSVDAPYGTMKLIQRLLSQGGGRSPNRSLAPSRRASLAELHFAAEEAAERRDCANFVWNVG